MTRFNRHVSRIVLVLAMGLLIALPGCDALTESVVLTADSGDGLRFRFTFDSDNLTTGQLAELTSNNSVDLSSFLSANGYSKEEILSAEVTVVELILGFPGRERLDFLNEATLLLASDGLTAREVARQTTFPSDREVNLEVVAGRDVSAFVESSSFSARLFLNPSTLLPNEQYEIEVNMTLRIEVEGV